MPRMIGGDRSEARDGELVTKGRCGILRDMRRVDIKTELVKNRVDDLGVAGRAGFVDVHGRKGKDFCFAHRYLLVCPGEACANVVSKTIEEG